MVINVIDEWFENKYYNECLDVLDDIYIIETIIEEEGYFPEIEIENSAMKLLFSDYSFFNSQREYIGQIDEGCVHYIEQNYHFRNGFDEFELEDNFFEEK